MANYVNNKKLKSDLSWYIEHNWKDDGSWLDKYGRRTKKAEFVDYRKQLVASIKARMDAMDEEEKKKFLKEFERRETELINEFYAIIDGRMGSYKLRATKSKEDCEDCRQFAILSLLKYYNRYDHRKNTSAFCYITEVATQAINLYLKGESESMWSRVLMDDYEQNAGHEEYYGDNDE